MLTQICAYLRNYFLADYLNPDAYFHHGIFEITDGEIQDLPFLLPGQYFRVIGSVFNDGVWQYRPDGEATAMKDEVFGGSIWAMSVPPDVVALAAEIQTWCDANKASLASPYVSESFGGYSYTKRIGYGAGGSQAAAFGWQDQFASQLAPYRRLSVL